MTIIPQTISKIPIGSQILPTKHGVEILVDAEDYPELSKRKWCLGNGYPQRRDGKKITLLHRLLMSPPEGMEVDHINGDKLDNRKSNLRICTHAQNSTNTKKPKSNTSGYKGVTRTYDLRRWVANISVNGKQKYLGQYKNIEDAASAYKKAAEKYFGEYHRVS